MHSFNLALVTLAIITAQFTSAVPAPWHGNSDHLPKYSSAPSKNANAYSGAGGQASGGSVITNSAPHDGPVVDLVNAFVGGGVLNFESNNAAPGGVADSAPAYVRNRRHEHGQERVHEAQSNSVVSESAYSGAGGQSPGGSRMGAAGLINILSNNAGPGGYASSGASTVEHGN